MKSAELRDHLPATTPWSKAKLFRMLDQYGTVMVKPAYGWGGQGVMKIARTTGDTFNIHYNNRVRTAASRDEVYQYVNKKRGKSSAIIQQYIPLARTSGRPFDLRVMVQRRSVKSSKWEVTGKLAKIAGKGYIITNVQRSNGKVVSASKAIRSSDITGASISHILEEVDRISRICAKRFGQYYKSIHTIGMDIGLDKNGKVWIIEGNFTPNLFLFKKLNKDTFRKIVNYSK